MWAAERTFGPVRAAFTDRAGGVSGGPYDSLNLGGHVGDDIAAVRTNRARVAGSLGAGADVRYMDQVHGTDVAVVDHASPAPHADAMVTRDPSIALGVLVADCVPILLADPDAGVVAAVHAGRQGVSAGVVPAAVAVMREQGAGDIRAVVGPSICPRCYEVPAEMHDAVAARVPATAARSVTGTPALDLAAGVLAQLAAAGVHAEHVPGCTREDPRFFSYRRDGVTGRFAGVVGVTGAGAS